MAKKEPTNSNVNTNNNVNNIHIHPHKPHAKKHAEKADKLNWLVKAIIVGIIGLGLSLIGYYVKHNTGVRAAVINENSKVKPL
jgi:uncharacterized protein HemX